MDDAGASHFEAQGPQRAAGASLGAPPLLPSGASGPPSAHQNALADRGAQKMLGGGNIGLQGALLAHSAQATGQKMQTQNRQNASEAPQKISEESQERVNKVGNKLIKQAKFVEKCPGLKKQFETKLMRATGLSLDKVKTLQSNLVKGGSAGSIAAASVITARHNHDIERGLDKAGGSFWRGVHRLSDPLRDEQGKNLAVDAQGQIRAAAEPPQNMEQFMSSYSQQAQIEGGAALQQGPVTHRTLPRG